MARPETFLEYILYTENKDFQEQAKVYAKKRIAGETPRVSAAAAMEVDETLDNVLEKRIKEVKAVVQGRKVRHAPPLPSRSHQPILSRAHLHSFYSLVFSVAVAGPVEDALTQVPQRDHSGGEGRRGAHDAKEHLPQQARSGPVREAM